MRSFKRWEETLNEGKELRHHLGDGRELEPVVEDLLVHIVGHDPDMRMAQQHLAQRLQFVG